MPEKLRANAELVRSQFPGELTYDEKGVEWLDGYIERIREDYPREKRGNLASSIGCFIGECVIRVYGGEWKQNAEGNWGVKVNDKLTVNPLGKAAKQFDNGSGDSVLGFFRAIKALKDR